MPDFTDLIDLASERLGGACSVDGCDLPDDAAFDAGTASWGELLARTPLQPHARPRFSREVARQSCTHVRLNIHPDGGVARFRVLGRAEARS